MIENNNHTKKVLNLQDIVSATTIPNFFLNLAAVSFAEAIKIVIYDKSIVNV